MDPEVDVVVIGAGIVGLACAVRFAQRGASVLVVERHGRPGQETSSRNSGVIHAGLYYPRESLKSQLCVEGRERLYAWCKQHQIEHRQTGKLVVATQADEEAKLEEIYGNATSCGVTGLELWDRAMLHTREPALRATMALWSPASGIVDVHGFLQSLMTEAQRAHVSFVWRTSVVGFEPRSSNWIVRTTQEKETIVGVRSRVVVNAAGLEADGIALMAGIDIDTLKWRLEYWKGDYFALSPSAPRTTIPLVYPVPSHGGLGIHLTEDPGGHRKAGPDAFPVHTINYDVDSSKAEAFARAIARYLPGVTAEHLRPDYAGIRPKRKPVQGFQDFVISENPKGIIHLIGIESPGLTASLAISDYVTRQFPVG